MLSNLHLYSAIVTTGNTGTAHGEVKLLVDRIVKDKPLSIPFYPLIFWSGRGHGTFFPVYKDDMVIAVCDPDNLKIGYFFPAYPCTADEGGSITSNRALIATPHGDKIQIGKGGDILIENECGTRILMSSNGEVEIDANAGGRFNLLKDGTVNFIAKNGAKIKLGHKINIETNSSSLKTLFHEIINTLLSVFTKGSSFVPAYADEIPKISLLKAEASKLLSD